MSIAPVSSHPAFKWAVAGWFALLLGAGLMVLPDAVHANIARGIGLSEVLPAGLTGKAVLAGIAALFGLLLGLVIAIRITTLNEASIEAEEETPISEAEWLANDEAPEVHEDLPRRPFNPREEIGDEMEPRADEQPRAEPEPVFDEDADSAEIDEVDVIPVEPEPIAVEPDEQPCPEHEPAERSAPEHSRIQNNAEALGDLSLEELIRRLERALAASSRRADATPVQETDEDDPVVAFLRREANRAVPDRIEPAGDEDPQTVLKSALDRLSQVGKPK